MGWRRPSSVSVSSISVSKKLTGDLNSLKFFTVLVYLVTILGVHLRFESKKAYLKNTLPRTSVGPTKYKDGKKTSHR